MLRNNDLSILIGVQLRTLDLGPMGRYFRFIDKAVSSNRGISKSNGFGEEKGKLST